MNAPIKKRAVLVLFPLLMLLIASNIYAQSQFISGTVVDQKGLAVPNAIVRITDTAKNVVAREVTTDENGRFQAIGIQPGDYKITIEASGFKTLSQTNVKLDVNTKLDVGELALEIGDIQSTVEIVSDLPVVQTNTMEKAFIVDNRQIKELPLNGRNWVALISTTPGVTSMARNDFDTNFNDVSGLHAMGGRGSQNNFLLDGSPNLDVGDNQSQYTQPSVFSIAEFKVQSSSFNAEYGRSSGLVVAVQTRAGTSQFHGTLYEYARNDAFDAKRPDTPLKDKLRYHLFGGNIGGWIPIPKVSTKDNKKLFFFYNREMTRRQSVASGVSFLDIPGPRTLINGDFSPFLLNSPMTCAPQFNVGTIFQPGTVVYGSAGTPENPNPCANQIVGGTPFTGNVVPASIWNANSANLLKIFTQIPGYANFPALGNPGYVRWFFSSPNKLDKDQDLLRVDYNISSSTTTFFRWVRDDQSENQPGHLWGNVLGVPSQLVPFGPMTRPKPGSSWSWNLVKTISPTLASETILTYNHQSQSLTPSDNSLDRDTLGVNFTELYPSTNTTNHIPNFNAFGGNNLPEIRASWGSPGWHNDGKAYSFTENITWVKGDHNVKFGFYYNRDNKKQTANFGSAQGEISFDSNPRNPRDTGSGLANLLLGSIGERDTGQGSGYGQASAAIYPYFRFQSWESYVQDNWKVNRKLTVEFGARFQHTTPTYTYTRDGNPGDEGTFRLYSVDLSRYSASRAPTIDPVTGRIVGDALSQLLANGLVCDPCDGVERGFSGDKKFISPRIGFAYDVFGDGKTALRGGFGQYVERLRQNNFNFGAGARFPNGVGASVTNTNINNITPGAPGGAVGASIAPPAYLMFPVDNTMPKIYSWNLGVQRDLGKNFALDISYVGNRATHLMVQRLINGRPAGYRLTNPSTERDDLLRPFQGFGAIMSVETSGSSEYNGLLTRLSRRFTNGFSFNVNYTWSKTFDIVDNDDGQLINPFDIRANWAPAGYDVTHAFTIDYIYQFPTVRGFLDNSVGRAVFNGWQLSGITRAQTGVPINVSAGGDLRGIDAGTQQVDLVGDPYAGQSEKRWLNPDAFRQPLDGQFGNLHRNALRGPGFNNWDVSLTRFIKIRESMNLRFGMDVFNIFNHPQIFLINSSFTGSGSGSTNGASKTFGTVAAFREPRILQFSLKFEF